MSENIMKFVVTVVLGAIFQLVLAWPLMLLWNIALVPAIDGVHQIDWIQAWLIMLIASLLFRSEINFKK
jgi:hypothetical protein